MLIIVALFIIGAINILMGLLVLVRDYHNIQNRLFFFFSLSLAGWVMGIGGFLASNDPSIAFAWAKIYYTFPLLIAAIMPFFAHAFPVQEKTPLSLRLFAVLGLLGLVGPLLLFHSFLTQALVYHDWGKEITLNKTAYSFYSVYLLSLFAAGLLHVYVKAKHLKRRERDQARAFFWGFILTSAMGVFFNLILPWFGNYRLIWLGPIFTNAFIIATGYSIVKHGLFDIRFYVVRAAAYALTIVTLSTLYIGPILFIMIVVLGYPFNAPRFTIALVVASIAAFYYQNLRLRFNHITSRIFFRDDYDSEVFIAQLNRAVVSNLNISSMLFSAAEIVAQNIKAEYCYFVLQGGTSDKTRTFGKAKKVLSGHDVMEINQDLTRMDTKIVITDYILDDNSKIKQTLRANDVAVIGRLESNIFDNGPMKSYIVLGPKKGGNLYNTKDLRLLETIIDGLIVAIQNALRFEEIQNFNVTLQLKVEEATDKYRRANAKLKALDETKDDFISMASHQLRTPLTSVKGYISMVLEGDAGSITPTQRKMLDQAFVSSQRMVFLIADLLNVSRLKTGKFVLETSAVDLAKTVSDEVNQLKETAKNRSIELTYTKPADFPTLQIDETKIRQVIMNFIDNAIYYTPSGGKIHVELKNNPSTVELRVIDTGIGVPKHEQPHLFTKFYRAGNARQARPDGTGLGLFMAKKVILAHGGLVLFESHEGNGSTFGFALSKDKLAVAAPKPQPTAASAA